jgi:hypothetical protein
VSPDGREVIFALGGDTKSSVDGADWKNWPIAVKGAYAWKVAWCGKRTIALFQHGEYDEDHPGRFNGIDKRTLRIRDGSGEWRSVPFPEDLWPTSLESRGHGGVVWVVAQARSRD